MKLSKVVDVSLHFHIITSVVNSTAITALYRYSIGKFEQIEMVRK
jgi:hypothetical protein